LDASDWDLKGNGDDVGIVHNVVGGILSDTSWESAGTIDWDEVNEIEDLSNVDGEWFTSLSDEDLSGGGASGKINVVDVLSRVVVITGEGLGSSIIKRLLEEVGGGSRNSGGRRSSSGNNVQSIVLEEVQSSVVSN